MRQESRKKYWHRNKQRLLHRLYQKTGDKYPSPVAWSQYKRSAYSRFYTDGPADFLLILTSREQEVPHLYRLWDELR